MILSEKQFFMHAIYTLYWQVRPELLNLNQNQVWWHSTAGIVCPWVKKAGS